MKKINLSIIVPSFQSERFIEENLKNLMRTFDGKGISYEIICVDDGSLDATSSIAKKLAKINKKIKVVSYKKNHGKGYAVRLGFNKAEGRLLAFIDAGLELDPNDLLKFVKLMQTSKYDMVIGSKRHPKSRVVYPLQRKIISVGYQVILRTIFDIKVKDTQVGIKVFKRKLYEDIKKDLKVDGFAFDIEMLAFANKHGYKKIHEAPVSLKMEGKKLSTMPFTGGFLKNSIKVLIDTLKVFYEIKIKP